MAIKKTEQQVSVQMERIYSLYFKGYGSKAMLEICERVYYRVIILKEK